MNMDDLWRARLRAFYSKAPLPSTLTNSEFNQLVMQLPTGVYSMNKLADWKEKSPQEDGQAGGGGDKGNAADYRILEKEVTLQSYIQTVFLDMLTEPPHIPILTLPVYIAKGRLEKLDGWPDWKTLKGFLAGHNLMPFCVFKNKPVKLEGSVYYLCDIRVGFIE